MYTKEYSAEDIREMRDALRVSEGHLKVAEIFSTVQGEGPGTGFPVIFVRLQLCNLNCKWCDSIAQGTPILTEARGWVPIEDVREDEEIIGVSHDQEEHALQNRWTYIKATATNLVSHVEESALHITTEDGNSVTCTRNHPILVRRDHPSTNYTAYPRWEWVAADQIQEGDLLWSVGPLASTDVGYVETSDYKTGWLSGYDKGDGGWSNSSKNTRRYESVDPIITDRLERYLKDFNYAYVRRTRTISTGTLYQLDSKYIALNEFEDFHTNREWVRGFIAGFFDAEGMNNSTLPVFSNKKIDVLEDIATSLKLWGFDSAVSTNQKDGCSKLTVFGGVLSRLKFDAIFQYSKVGHRNKWLWNGQGRRGAHPFSSLRQAKNKVAVISIEEINSPTTFYDIGSSCGNYIAGGLAVHNTPYTWNWEGTDFVHDSKPYDKVKYDPREEIKIMSPEDILARVNELSNGGVIKRVIWTGGEPLVQQRSAAFVKTLQLLSENYFIEIETNGTLRPSQEVISAVSQFNVSPKLSNSGNSVSSRKVDKAYNFYTQQPNAYFKFVIFGDEDLTEIQSLQTEYNIPSEKILLMPEGRSEGEIKARALQIVELCKTHGYRFCNRLQVWIWDGALRGV